MRQALLSIAILFHLIAVIIVPNSQNQLGRFVAPIFEPYVQFFEFTNAWSFFAPEPGPPPVYIEYELIDGRGETIRFGQWPQAENPFTIRERQNRRIAVAEFMMGSELRSDRMMGGYLCRNFPEAHSVRIWRMMKSVPSWGEVAEGKRKIGDDIKLERILVSRNFCPGNESQGGKSP